MPNPTDLLTASKIAAQLKVTDAKVKKANAALALKPAAKKGACNFYEKSAIPKITKGVGGVAPIVAVSAKTVHFRSWLAASSAAFVCLFVVFDLAECKVETGCPGKTATRSPRRM
jgi:O-acetyl-ADP-ribose deacetylase (regulator of RNase III)